jgi:copper chaperone CopZ
MKQTLQLTIEGMHCTSCAMDIDGTLEDTEGVLEANTNYARQVLTVSFNDEQMTKEKIVSIVSSLGYRAK